MCARRLDLSADTHFEVSPGQTDYLDLFSPQEGELELSVRLGAGSCLYVSHVAGSELAESGVCVRVNVHMQERSQLHGLLQTRGRGVRALYHAVLDQPGSRICLYGLACLRGSESCHQSFVVSHQAPDCHSEAWFRSVLDGRSVANFITDVTVAPAARGVKAIQQVHALILSRYAKQMSRPELHVHNQDVDCRHGASVGFPDEDVLLYFLSRQICRNRAHVLLSDAFLQDFVGRLGRIDPFLTKNLGEVSVVR